MGIFEIDQFWNTKLISEKKPHKKSCPKVEQLFCEVYSLFVTNQ